MYKIANFIVYIDCGSENLTKTYWYQYTSLVWIKMANCFYLPSQVKAAWRF